MDKSKHLDVEFTRILTMPGRPLSGLSVVMVREGRIAYEGYFGTRIFAQSPEEKDAPVDRHTMWRVASLSKPVTTLGVMRLVERGALDLDGDISNYLGYPLRNPAFPDQPITIRMLLGHTSSLRDAGFYYPPLTHSLQELFVPCGRHYDAGSHFAKPVPGKDMTPGVYYSYCNLGYALLGGIIERVAAKRFDRFMHDEVFSPLGIDGGFNPLLISDSHFGDISPIYRKSKPDTEEWDARGLWYPQVDNYRGKRPALPVRVPTDADGSLSLDAYRLGENGSLFSPQGGMRISARDLARIAVLFLNGGEAAADSGNEEAAGNAGTVRLVEPRSVEAMLTPFWRRNSDGSNCDDDDSLVFATGLGVMQPEGPRGGAGLWGHHGNAYGFLGGMFLDPERNSAYVYFVGGTGAAPEKNRGKTSRLFVWEEAIRRALEAAL